MSTLFIIWLTALLVLFGMLIVAHFRMSRDSSANIRVPNDFGEFLSMELHDVESQFRRLVHVFRPHGKQAVSYVVLVSRRGYDVFIERIFGRTEITKGKTTSFFLKHISEHKETRGGDDMPVQ